VIEGLIGQIEIRIEAAIEIKEASLASLVRRLIFNEI
jgi:hypothetical protein